LQLAKALSGSEAYDKQVAPSNCIKYMHDDKKIEEKAFEHLKSLSDSELEGINEIDFEIHLQNPDGTTERFTVFLERGFVDGKEGWTIRNIIRPDDLEKPENKEDGKIE